MTAFKIEVVLLTLCILIAMILDAYPSGLVSAQGPTYGTVGASPIAPTVADCPLSSPFGFAFCAVGTATYASYSGGAYQPLVGSQTPGIAVGSQITYTKTETCQPTKGSIPLGYTNTCAGTMTITA